MLLTPQQAAQKLEAMEKSVVENVRDAEMSTIITARAIAWGQTMGPFKTAWLRKHRPGLYSRKNPRPPADPGRINSQTGSLAQSWKASQENKSQDLVTALFNESESAKWIAGSGRGRSRMMRRPVEDRIVERLMPIRISNLKEAIRKALTL